MKLISILITLIALTDCMFPKIPKDTSEEEELIMLLILNRSGILKNEQTHKREDGIQ